MRLAVLALLALAPAALAEGIDAGPAADGRAPIEVTRSLPDDLRPDDTATPPTREAAEAALAPFRARVEELSSTAAWYAGPRPTMDGGAFWDAWTLGGLLVAKPEFTPTKKGVAEQMSDKPWHKERRSSYKVAFADGAVTDVMWSHYVLYEGRGTSETTTTTLVHYQAGVPTQAYLATVEHRYGEGRAEALLTFTWGPDGRLAGVDALRLQQPGTWGDEPEPVPSRQVWTRG
jgi:hypothetical protein